MLFISKTLRYSTLGRVRNTLKTVTFVIGKMKLVSLSFCLDASPSPLTQDALWTALCRYKHIQQCKGRLGSRGGKGVAQAKEYITHLIKVDHFARWWYLLYINCINILTLS